MSFCGTKPQESDRQKKLNAYIKAVEVINSLRKEGKLDELCKVKGMAIPLADNIIGIVWGNTEIDIAVGKLKYFRPKKFEVVKA